MFEQSSVVSHVQHRLARYRQAIDARGRNVHDTPPLRLAAADVDDGRHLSIHEQDISFASVLLIDFSLRRIRIRDVGRSVGFEAIVREYEQLLRQRSGERIVRVTNDDRAEQSHRHLIAGTNIRMRMIPIRAGGSARDGEDVISGRCPRKSSPYKSSLTSYQNRSPCRSPSRPENRPSLAPPVYKNYRRSLRSRPMRNQRRNPG